MDADADANANIPAQRQKKLANRLTRKRFKQQFIANKNNNGSYSPVENITNQSFSSPSEEDYYRIYRKYYMNPDAKTNLANFTNNSRQNKSRRVLKHMGYRSYIRVPSYMNSVIETIAAAAASPGDEPLPAQIAKSLQKISIEMPSLRLEMKNPGDDIYLSDILKSNKMTF